MQYSICLATLFYHIQIKISSVREKKEKISNRWEKSSPSLFQKREWGLQTKLLLLQLDFAIRRSDTTNDAIYAPRGCVCEPNSQTRFASWFKSNVVSSKEKSPFHRTRILVETREIEVCTRPKVDFSMSWRQNRGF